jgi:hypothetical protein
MRYLVLLAAAMIVSADRVEAASIYPWCAHYMMGNAPQNCGFSTLEQCRLTVAGIGGSCEFNPYYAASPPAAVPRSSRRSRYRGG